MYQNLHSSIASEPELWSLKTIERATVVFAILFLVTSLYLWPSFSIAGGVVSGALVGFLNFKFLKKLVTRLLDVENRTTQGSRNGVNYFLKMIVLIAIVGTLLLGLQVNPVAFLVGFSSIVLAIFYEGLKSLI